MFRCRVGTACRRLYATVPAAQTVGTDARGGQGRRFSRAGSAAGGLDARSGPGAGCPLPMAGEADAAERGPAAHRGAEPGKENEQEHAGQAGCHGVEPAPQTYVLAAGHGDDSRGASRRMRGAGHAHDGDGRARGHARGEPGIGAGELTGGHAGQGPGARGQRCGVWPQGSTGRRRRARLRPRRSR